MKLDDSTNDQLMAMAAHRYCLGRSSYIVGACQDWLRATWGDFTPSTRNAMVRDTIEALMDGTTGMAMDARSWRNFARWAWEKLDEPARAWVKDAVAWKKQPWPIEEGA